MPGGGGSNRRERLAACVRDRALREEHITTSAPPGRHRLTLGVTSNAILTFAAEEPHFRPYAESPFHWAPFVFAGV
jgi:hypothetical protein